MDVSDEILMSIGILHWHIPINAEGKYEQKIAAIAKERNYKNHDIKLVKRALVMNMKQRSRASTTSET
jgi:1,2-dihydroxy-3-keto-5-methylthiopentene dioxygenase